MSEFERLMREGSPKSKERLANRSKQRNGLLWALGISFLFTVVPPHFGGPFFVLVVLIIIFYANREWMG